MKKKTLLAGFAFILCSSLNARQITSAEAQTRIYGCQARARIGGNTQDIRDLELIHTVSNDSCNLMYIYNAGNEGFVIASADDLAPAVLAYGSTPFDMSNIPANVRYWLSLYEKNIADAIANNREIRVNRARQAEVLPLIKTKWGQEKPYSNELQNGYVTGCVATAAAQIMNYHQWPSSYNWKVMQDLYGTYYPDNSFTQSVAQYSDASAKEVARLMHNIGVACDADYGPVTGASSVECAIQLVKTFGYDKGMIYRDRKYYTDEDWEELMRSELENGRPVFYSADTRRGEGHAFILDGYTSEYFHINWGWNGLCDGYYLITGTSSLNPPMHGVGGSSVGDSFIEDQQALIGLQKPVKGSTYKEVFAVASVYTLTLGTYGCYVSNKIDGSTIVTGTLTTNHVPYICGQFFNKSLTNLNTKIGVLFRNTADNSIQYQFEFQNVHYDVAPNSGYSSFSFTCSSIKQNGEYEVIPIFRTFDETGKPTSDWKPMDMPANVETHKIVIIDADRSPIYVSSVTLNKETATIKKGKSLTLTATASSKFADNTDIVWKSSNERVATVKDGVVTAIAPGSATITATAADRGIVSAKCEVTVVEDDNSGCYNNYLTIKTTKYGLDPKPFTTFEIANNGPYDIDVVEFILKEPGTFKILGYISLSGTLSAGASAQYSIYTSEAKAYDYEMTYTYKYNDYVLCTSANDPANVIYPKYEDFTAVGEIKEAENNADAVYYDMTGRRHSSPAKGISIIRLPDGSVRKIIR